MFPSKLLVLFASIALSVAIAPPVPLPVSPPAVPTPSSSSSTSAPASSSSAAAPAPPVAPPALPSLPRRDYDDYVMNLAHEKRADVDMHLPRTDIDIHHDLPRSNVATNVNIPRSDFDVHLPRTPQHPHAKPSTEDLEAWKEMTRREIESSVGSSCSSGAGGQAGGSSSNTGGVGVPSGLGLGKLFAAPGVPAGPRIPSAPSTPNTPGLPSGLGLSKLLSTLGSTGDVTPSSSEQSTSPDSSSNSPQAPAPAPAPEDPSSAPAAAPAPAPAPAPAQADPAPAAANSPNPSPDPSSTGPNPVPTPSVPSLHPSIASGLAKLLTPFHQANAQSGQGDGTRVPSAGGLGALHLGVFGAASASASQGGVPTSVVDTSSLFALPTSIISTVTTGIPPALPTSVLPTSSVGIPSTPSDLSSLGNLLTTTCVGKDRRPVNVTLSNDVAHCGSCQQECTVAKVPGASAVVCRERKCQAIACVVGYTLSGYACIKN
ncbi:hypothetical protein SISNIDRAFT_493551 [Sistotremastrum niveocremeum HHB9708]|uniref:Membrane anchor Opy2 N-terminal domain-containing protein n=1 Tax=Sistotremastrum niveocremeum HHB9708 TaxID=1314777 RepID=A0A164Z2N8_9AGAM|nr:hypothetical protein SISNIDRAFT_493551 [Sistotremastrum niveocremeum HHB9708]